MTTNLTDVRILMQIKHFLLPVALIKMYLVECDTWEQLLIAADVDS